MPEIVVDEKKHVKHEHNQSLRGHITIEDMGSRVIRSKPFIEPKKATTRNEPVELVMTFLQSYLPEVSHEVLSSAAQALIDVVRDSSLNEDQKQKAVESVIGPVQQEDLNKLFQLSKELEDDDEMEDAEPLDVEFSESDSDASGESEDGEYGINHEHESDEQPWESDPHYLNKLLLPTGKKPSDVLKLLEDSTDLEEDLLELFDFGNLNIIKQLLQNSKSILWHQKFLTAETGIERESARHKLQELNLPRTEKKATLNTIDLQSLRFSSSSRFIPSEKVVLPPGSTKTVYKQYEQYTIPPQEKTKRKGLPISELPEYTHAAFSIPNLNAMQAEVANAALSEGNMLVCAPTGAGKTNVALLCMLKCFHDFPDAKIVYISPLKALVQEQVQTFTARLQGITVAELSGDRGISSDQIESTQVIVSTPEKWDVVTRKSFDVGYVSQVKLIIIDEIHLLHDPRGPALESIVARSLKISPDTRLVGLSATLPNYRDVGSFLQAEHVFYFDSSYRPCPLKQIFVGVTEKSPFKRHQALNEICAEKIKEYDSHQIIVFVHSRKDTERTARFLMEQIPLQQTDSVATTRNTALQELLPKGIGIHHAGLHRSDRAVVETLFRDRKLKVLVSTATLAWGVNLPAHTVIIKGTQVYNPQEGQWEELSPQDVLQMLGRAGRPGFDSVGEGVVLTMYSELEYYISVTNSSFPIESQLIARLPDAINAEVSLGTIRSLDDAVDWLARTYYYVRMLKAPQMYRVGTYNDDPTYRHRRMEIMHTVLELLQKYGLAKYRDGNVLPTEIGKIASDFYISAQSMSTYTKQLKPYLQVVDVLRVFAKSEEFKHIPVRLEEKTELKKLSLLVPIPVRDEAKIAILTQAYISRIPLQALALSADMVYISQSASRIFRAMFEIAVIKKWPRLLRLLHDFYLEVDKRLWLANSPLHQFQGVPSEALKKIEMSPMPWIQYFDLDSPEEVGQAIRSPENGEIVWDMLHKFPRFELVVTTQPITPSLLRMHVDAECLFQWDRTVHGKSQQFLLYVEDSDGEALLHYEWFVLRDSQGQSFQFVVPLMDPMPSSYFVTILSDNWIQSRSMASVNLGKINIPTQFPPQTAVKHRDLVDVSHIDFSFSKPFDLVSSQVYELLYASDSNAFVGMLDTDLCIELLIARHLQSPGTILIMHTSASRVDVLAKKFNAAKLTGDPSADLEAFRDKVVVGTARHVEFLLRRWRKRVFLNSLGLVIADGVHYVGGLDGQYMEIAMTQLKVACESLGLSMRLVGLGLPLADFDSVGSWLDAKRASCSFFEGLNVEVKSFGQRTHKSRELMMLRDIREGLIVVNDRDMCIELALKLAEQQTHSTEEFDDKLLEKCVRHGVPFLYKHMSSSDFKKVLKLKTRYTVATADCCFVTPYFDNITIIAQFFDYVEQRYMDMTAAEVLEFAKNTSNLTIFTTPQKHDYYERFLSGPLPIESHINYFMNDIITTQVAEGVSTPDQILEWLGSTFFFHRLRANPSYYDLESVQEDDVNAFLSELVEGSIEELSETSLVEAIEDEESFELRPLGCAHIATHYGCTFQAMSLFVQLGGDANLIKILEAISQADYGLSTTSNEQRILRKTATPLHSDLDPIPFKVFVLLQCHLSRIHVPEWLRKDQELIVLQSLQYLKAIIDLLSASGNLNTLIAIDLHQMITQGLWDKDSPLKQIPYVDDAAVDRCMKNDITNIYDFLAIEEDDIRNFVLGFDEQDPRMLRVADFANKFPSIDVQAEYDGESLTVTVEREVDEDDLVISPLPGIQHENWYIILGSITTRELYVMRKVSLTEAEQKFTIPVEASGELKVWCICDSYLEADKEVEVSY